MRSQSTNLEIWFQKNSKLPLADKPLVLAAIKKIFSMENKHTKKRIYTNIFMKRSSI